MISEPVQNTLQSALDILRRGDLDGGHAELERILQHDLENKDVVYCLQAVCFWREKFDQMANNTSTAFEAGEYIISQWKPFIGYMKKHGELRVNVIDAIKCTVFHIALDCYRKLYEDESIEKNAELYRKIALCCKALGDYDSAVNFLKKAIALNKDSPAILADLADSYALCGDFRYSKVYFREAFFKDASKIDIHFLESELICKLVDTVSKLGYSDNELAEWIPVYGVLTNIFSVKRELKALEIGQLKQRIFWLENEIRQNSAEKSVLLPKLINSYFWLIDHYIGGNASSAKIEDVLLKIKILDLDVYNKYNG